LYNTLPSNTEILKPDVKPYKTGMKDCLFSNFLYSVEEFFQLKAVKLRAYY